MCLVKATSIFTRFQLWAHVVFVTGFEVLLTQLGLQLNPLIVSYYTRIYTNLTKTSNQGNVNKWYVSVHWWYLYILSYTLTVINKPFTFCNLMTKNCLTKVEYERISGCSFSDVPGAWNPRMFLVPLGIIPATLERCQSPRELRGYLAQTQISLLHWILIPKFLDA